MICARCGEKLDQTIDSDICGSCADDLRDEENERIVDDGEKSDFSH